MLAELQLTNLLSHRFLIAGMHIHSRAVFKLTPPTGGGCDCSDLGAVSSKQWAIDHPRLCSADMIYDIYIYKMKQKN